MNNDARSHGRTCLAGALLAAAASMTTGEFVEVQKLSADGLRTRFGLPASCDPSLTALATDPAVNLVTVAVDCRARPDGALLPVGPGERQRPPRQPGKGS
jgi:hypothetical protein